MLSEMDLSKVLSLTPLQSRNFVMDALRRGQHIRKKGPCHNKLWQLIYVTIYIKVTIRYIQKVAKAVMTVMTVMNETKHQTCVNKM